MKFTCTQENLAHGLSIVSRVASKNVALPILNNVLCVAENNQIKLQTTNLEAGIQVIIRGKIESPGRFTVPSRLLTEFIGFLGNEKITLELAEDGVKITSGHSQTTIKTLPTEDFPVLPTVSDATETSVPASTFRACLEGVVFAATSDEARPEISGIYFQLNDKILTLAATDSYRLAERRCQTLQASTTQKNAIVPARTAQELLRVVQADGDEVTIRLGDSQASFGLGETEIVTRLIDGRYPEYQQIIPAAWQTKVLVNREALINNTRAASLFCKAGINDVTLTVKADKKSLELQAANTQHGEHEATIEAGVEGGNNAAVFNYRYLLDGLQSFEGDAVSLELTDGQAPGVLRSPKQADSLYLLMPIRQ